MGPRDRDEAVALERDALLRLLGESARDVVFRIRAGPPPAFDYVSPAVSAVTGYTAEEFYRDPELGLRIVHPDDRHLAADPALVEARPEGQVIRWVRKDGRVIHVESRGTVLRDAGGAVLAFEGIIRDVTARIHAEEALRESEARLRSVFAAMAEGVVIFDTEGRIVECNASAERIMGLPRGQLLARNSHEDWQVLRSDGTPFPPAEYPANRTLGTGVAVRNELLGMLQRDGMVRWLAMSSEPLRLGGAAKPHGVLTSFADMTAERHAWVEVRRREAQLRLAMECAGHAYWELDARRGELGPEGRIAGEPAPGDRDRWMAVVHPEDRARARADLEAHVEGRRPVFTSEYRMSAPDGGWRWVQLSGRATARDEAGRATHLAGTITDVTEAKRLQERLRHADRLAGVGTLAAGVAHEVNNPLAYVSANLVAVEEALAALAPGAPPDPARIEDLRRAVRDAMDGAARVRGIVQGLRQFAQPARGEERRPVDVKAELEAAIGIARNEIAHRAQLRLDVPDGLPPVRAAPHELGQVFVNLLVNAAQAIPERRATENEIRVSARAEGDRVVVEVHDTGAGIPAADLPRVFDPFFTTKPVGTGTGLGLSVCHGIVTAIGGSIDVESPPGEGTTFRVRLPVFHPEAARAAPRAAAAAPAASRGRVLVLDDEPLVGKSLARLLSAHEVTVLTSPLEVLRRAASGERWDVVLCDLMMPEMSGMELEERLQAEAPDLVPRIVYLTGGAFTDRSRAFLEAGRPHLEKPVEPADLRARVADLVAARQKG